MKSTFLKVMSILLIISGAISLVVNIWTLPAFIGSPFAIIGILSLVISIVYLIAGILGIPGSKDPAKAKKCVILGIIMIILIAVSLAVQFGTGYLAIMAEIDEFSAELLGTQSMMSPLFYLAEFVMPVLYLVAAALFARKTNNKI